MGNNLLLILAVFIWGFTTFVQKLAADKMSPILMQIVIGTAFVCFIPFALKMGDGLDSSKWNLQSILITFGAAVLSLTANILMYTALRNNHHTGASVMLVSLYPTVTLMLSAIFLHETFTGLKIVGVISMIAGAIMLCLG